MARWDRLDDSVVTREMDSGAELGELKQGLGRGSSFL